MENPTINFGASWPWQKIVWACLGFGIVFWVVARIAFPPTYIIYVDGDVLSLRLLFFSPMIAALILSGMGRLHWLLAALLPAIAIPSVVMTRVVMDCMDDPTHHNLWPFEVVPAGIVGLAGGLAGAGIGVLLWRGIKKWMTSKK